MTDSRNSGNNHTEQSAVPAPERTPLTAKSEYLQAAEKLLGLAQLELRIFDRDLSETRLDTPARIETLRQFLARSQYNRVYVALHDVEYVKSYCPRLIALLGTFAGRMTIHRTQGEAAKVQDCFILADRNHVLRRPVVAQARGVLILNDRRQGQIMRDRFEEIWENSEPGVSANTTGL